MQTGLKLVHTVVWLLPSSRVKRWMLNCLGDEIAGTAHAGANVVLNARGIALGANATLTAGNVIHGPVAVRLLQGALIGRWNWMSGAAGFSSQDGRGEITLQDGAVITSRHYIDGTGGVRIGRMTTIAGHRTTILTHGIEQNLNAQVAHPVVVGEFCLIGSDTRLVPGSVVADRCVIGMGSVVVGKAMLPNGVYAGSPAQRKKDIDPSAAYFHRSDPHVGVIGWQVTNRDTSTIRPT